MKVMLVYQGGIANVFRVDCFNLADFERNAERLYRGSFRAAISFVRAIQATGTEVKTAACNQAGDIRTALWSEDFNSQPFNDQFIIV